MSTEERVWSACEERSTIGMEHRVLMLPSSLVEMGLLRGTCAAKKSLTVGLLLLWAEYLKEDDES